MNHPVTSYKLHRWILAADMISSAILLLFLYTGLSKLYEHQLFIAVLKKSPLLHPFAAIISVALPLSEILIALLLLIPKTRLKGLYFSLLLITVFTAYLIFMVIFSPGLPCNCGGVIKLLTWKQHIFFNLFFILLSLSGIILYRNAKDILIHSPP